MSHEAPRFATIQSLLAYRMAAHRGPLDSTWAEFMRAARANWFVASDLGIGVRALARGPLRGMSAEQILYEHSVFPLYEALMLEPQQAFWRAAVMDGKPMALCLVNAIRSAGMIHDGTMRACVACASRDLQLYGNAFWRTFHQLPCARTCAVHGTALKDRCEHCQTPYLRSHWSRLPSHGCRGCRMPQLDTAGRPASTVGEREHRTWVLSTLEAAADARRTTLARPVAKGASAAPGNRLLPRMLQAWECESPEQLRGKLGCPTRVLSPLHRAVLGDKPAALQHAVLAHEEASEQRGHIAMGNVCNSDYAQIQIARRKCISQPKRNPLRLVAGWS